MSNNYCSGYDPLVANGILPMSVDSMVRGNIIPVNSLPIRSGLNECRQDCYSPCPKNINTIPTWKKCLFAALLTTAAFFGLKKCGFKPIQKFKESFKLNKIGNFIADKFSKTKNFIANIFKKKS